MFHRAAIVPHDIINRDSKISVCTQGGGLNQKQTRKGQTAIRLPRNAPIYTLIQNLNVCFWAADVFLQGYSLSPCLRLIINGAAARLSAGSQWGRHYSERWLPVGIAGLPRSALIGWGVTESFHLKQRAGRKTLSEASAAVYFLWMLRNTRSPVPASASQGSDAWSC